MNVETIAMPATEARALLIKYRQSRLAETDREVKAAIAGYRALSRGKRLLDLAQVFARCPFDDHALPRLAIARADLRRIRFRWDYGEEPTGSFMPEGWGPKWSYRARFGRRPAGAKCNNHETVVPLIPPDVRPALSAEREHVVLWEVEDWQDVPRDPFLLRQLTGALYVIVAAWDLTGLERAIIRSRGA